MSDIKPKDFVADKPRPRPLDRPKEPVRSTSIKNEKRLSAELGFSLTPGSGSTSRPSRKGDGSTDQFMVECKETKGSRLTLNHQVLSKLWSEATAVGKDPVLVMSLYGLPEPLPKDWVIFPAYLFREV